MTHFLQDQDIKLKIVENMHRYGGSFVQALAEAILRADHINLQIIENSWPKYIQEYHPEQLEKKHE